MDKVFRCTEENAQKESTVCVHGMEKTQRTSWCGGGGVTPNNVKLSISITAQHEHFIKNPIILS